MLQTPTSKRLSQNRSREVFQVTDDKTQLDGESAERIVSSHSYVGIEISLSELISHAMLKDSNID